MLAFSFGPIVTATGLLRSVSCIVFALVCVSAGAQYAPVPGPRSSLIPALVVPWLLLLAALGWSFTSSGRQYRSAIRRSVLWSFAAVGLPVVAGFAALQFIESLVRVDVEFALFYFVLFSGPLALIIAVLVLTTITVARRFRAKTRVAAGCSDRAG